MCFSSSSFPCFAFDAIVFRWIQIKFVCYKSYRSQMHFTSAYKIMCECTFNRDEKNLENLEIRYWNLQIKWLFYAKNGGKQYFDSNFISCLAFGYLNQLWHSFWLDTSYTELHGTFFVNKFTITKCQKQGKQIDTDRN